MIETIVRDFNVKVEFFVSFSGRFLAFHGVVQKIPTFSPKFVDRLTLYFADMSEKHKRFYDYPNLP